MDTYAVSPGWRVLARDLGVDLGEILRSASLPVDLVSRPGARIDAEGFFALWNALEAAHPRGDIALLAARAVSAEAFEPALFAGLCSPSLAVAARRIATYKRLLYPVTLDVDDGHELVIAVRPRGALEPPAVLARFELIFWVAFARLGTREPIRPSSVVLPEAAPDPDALVEYLGTSAIRTGGRPEIRFSELDARRSFVTANDLMWRAFEPDLKRRLETLEHDATWADRVRAALLTALPAGRRSVGEIATDLHLSGRSLQRRLAEEGVSFQSLLDQTRERLARHYLTTTALSDTEIAFLIGYDELTSFHRAFRTWTGHTPRQARAAVG